MLPCKLQFLRELRRPKLQGPTSEIGKLLRVFNKRYLFDLISDAVLILGVAGVGGAVCGHCSAKVIFADIRLGREGCQHFGAFLKHINKPFS